MKKFLLTLLFCIFANPIFAQTTNIQIQIDKSVKENLMKIKNDLTKYINDNICGKDTNNNNPIEFQTELEETSCNPKKTIGDIYNCVCKNGKIANDIKGITEFSGLTYKNILSDFQTIQKFYKSLNSIPEITMLKDAITTAVKAQAESEKQQKDAKREEILSQIKTELRPLIEHEINLRNELGLNIPNDLETHFKDIQDFVINKKGTLDKAIDAYIDTLRQSDLTNDQLADSIKEEGHETEPEIALTRRNIERLNNAQKELDEKLNKEIDDAYKNLLDPLQKLNKLECQIYGGIDVIATATQKPFNNNTFTYQTIGISGKRITCNGKQLTIDNIKSTSTSEKSEWIKCIEKKANIIEYNNTGLENYINNIGEENSCPIKECIHNVDKYEKWYDGNNNTKPEYKGQTPIIDKQLEQCKIDNFECEGISDFAKGKNFKTLQEAQDACKQAQEEAEKLKKEADKANERQKAKATIINMYNTMCNTIYKSLGTNLENKETNGTGTTTKGRFNNGSISKADTADTTKYKSKHNKDVLEYAKAITIYSCTPEQTDAKLKTELRKILKKQNNGQCHAISGGEGDSAKKVLDNIFEGYLKNKHLTSSGSVCEKAKRIVENINK